MTFADAFTVNDETWDEIFNVNVRAPMRITRAVLAEMAKANRGSIINIGSSWSTRASVFNQDGGGVDYCSSKAALHTLTRATAQDAAPKNIRVNTIAPGAVDTPMHADHRALLFEFEKYIPLGRIQVAEDVAGAVIFLASDASAYITGQTLHVNGGLLMVDLDAIAALDRHPRLVSDSGPEHRSGLGVRRTQSRIIPNGWFERAAWWAWWSHA